MSLPRPRIDFHDDDWAAALHALATQQGRLHGEYGIDYLATTRPGIWARPRQSAKSDDGLPGQAEHDKARQALLSLEEQRPSIAMPPFLVGVFRWDSFAVARAIMSPSIAVFDATAAVMAVHLQCATAGEPPQHRRRRGALYSDRFVHNLIGKRYLMGRTVNADYELTAGGELLPRVSSLVI